MYVCMCVRDHMCEWVHNMAVLPHMETRGQPLVPQELSTVLQFIFVSVCVCVMWTFEGQRLVLSSYLCVGSWD